MFGFTGLRRKRLMRKQFPDEWVAILHRNVPLYRHLPADKQKKLHGLIHIFLHEKTFEGCSGLSITDEIRLTIASQACILMLGLENISAFYPDLRSILVYPHHYAAPVKEVLEGGFVEEGLENRNGESWSHGTIVLAWDEVRRGASDYRDGYNLVLHEFAHHLDYEYGATRPIDDSIKDDHFLAWARVLSNEYQDFLQELAQKQETLFDEYGSKNIAEFFAVVTECFFEKPEELNYSHPELYRHLTLFYQQDPLKYMKSGN